MRRHVGEIRNKKQPMKYIVYCTTNLKNGKVYIGVHKTQTPYEFDGYLGCGVKVPTKVDKPFKINNPDTPFKKAVNKYGYKSFYRTLIAVFDNENEAYELEKILVNKDFVSNKNSYNIGLGGNQPSPQVRQVLQYSIDGKFIKLWESITEASNNLFISIPDIISSCIERQISAGGFVWRYTSDNDPKEQIIVRSRVPSNKGDINALPVVQYSRCGYKMRRFISIAEAAMHLNIPQQNISACCNSYINNKSAGGYQWRFESDNIELLTPLDSKTHVKPVLQIQNGEVVAEYKSSREAAKSIGVEGQHRTIRKACTTNTMYKGYFWKFKVEDMIYEVK